MSNLLIIRCGIYEQEIVDLINGASAATGKPRLEMYRVVANETVLLKDVAIIPMNGVKDVHGGEDGTAVAIIVESIRREQAAAIKHMAEENSNKAPF